MDGRHFYTMVMADKDLELVRCIQGSTPAEDYVDIRHKPTGGGYRIAMHEILRADADQLFAVLKHERPARVMRRLVGDDCSREYRPSIRTIAQMSMAS